MTNDSKFYIAAIGLSAGGMEPLWSFFDHIPSNLDMAFIIIPHLGRNYVSVADELLAKHTAMQVYWANDRQKVEPNCVYLLPVNKMMTIEDSYLQLHDRQVADRSNWAIDIFFHSLARSEKANAIGIILSGVGSDGALGSVHIHDEGGIVMVQDPQTAEFKGMPESAIAKDDPDKILSPKSLAHALVNFVSFKKAKSREVSNIPGKCFVR